MRLDNFLVNHHNVKSRNKAQELINSGKVQINGKIIDKCSCKTDENMDIVVHDSGQFVSRSGYKLEQFLDENHISLQDKTALDIGSSTGGFSEVLLNNGIASIDCVDVGKDQLNDKIRLNPKVQVYENTDIRQFKSDKSYDIVVCDVSFIAIKNIIDYLDRFFYSHLIVLYKPQFEVGVKAKRDRHGVVIDTQQIALSKNEFELMTAKLNWQTIQKQDSKISGKRGNIETFYWFGR
ncbi:MAG: TlyA family RNA methyltransferase [Epsilonproteobacteria bacterium]|nr:MAG: TlyA family RNA methyltransferase [Campylobacterota bacterium]